MSKNSGFKLYVNQQFTKHFSYYLPDDFSLTHPKAEDHLINAMCYFYCDKIYYSFNFKEIKDNYKRKIATISPELDYIQTQKYVNSEQAKLETFARIKYGIMNLNDVIISPNIHILADLYLIYSKINRKSIKSIKQSKIYKYIKLSYASKTSSNLDTELNLSLCELSKDFYNNVDYLIYDNNFKYQLFENGLLKINDGREINLTPSEVKQFKFLEADYCQLSQFITEKDFQQHLIEEMHTLDNGMKF